MTTTTQDEHEVDPLEVADAILDALFEATHGVHVVSPTYVRARAGELRACVAVERLRRGGRE